MENRKHFIGQRTALIAASTTVTVLEDIDVMEYSRIVGSIKTDQDGTLLVLQSHDGTNYDISDSTAVTAGTTATFSVEVKAQYLKVTMQNTQVTDQTYCRLGILGRPI